MGSPREDFDRVYASACEQRGWTCGADRIEIGLEGGRHQVVQLEYFEYGGDPCVRLYSIIGSKTKIRPDRLVFALELNFGLPHGSFAVKDDLLVLVDTLLLEDTDVHELEACVTYLSETADHYERSMFGPDSY